MHITPWWCVSGAGSAVNLKVPTLNIEWKEIRIVTVAAAVSIWKAVSCNRHNKIDNNYKTSRGMEEEILNNLLSLSFYAVIVQTHVNFIDHD